MSKHIQGIELAVIVGRRGYAPDIIVNTETDEQVAACANPDLTALFAAAPKMYELLANLAAVCDSWDEDYENDEQRADAFWHMARIAKVLLLAKIEGGGDENHA